MKDRTRTPAINLICDFPLSGMLHAEMTIKPQIRRAAVVNQWYGVVILCYRPRFRSQRLWTGPVRATESAAFADAHAAAARMNTEPRELR